MTYLVDRQGRHDTRGSGTSSVNAVSSAVLTIDASSIVALEDAYGSKILFFRLLLVYYGECLNLACKPSVTRLSIAGEMAR